MFDLPGLFQIPAHFRCSRRLLRLMGSPVFVEFVRAFFTGWKQHICCCRNQRFRGPRRGGGSLRLLVSVVCCGRRQCRIRGTAVSGSAGEWGVLRPARGLDGRGWHWGVAFFTPCDIHLPPVKTLVCGNGCCPRQRKFKLFATPAANAVRRF